MSDIACGKARCIANNPYAYGDPDAYVCGPHDRIRELEAERLVLENFVRKLANYDYRGNPPWYVSEAIALLKDEGYV